MSTLYDNAEQALMQRTFIRSTVALLSSGSQPCEELAELLAEAGFLVVHHRNDDQVLRSLEREETDLLLVDICPNDQLGFELGRYLREDCLQRDVPLVFLGASTDPECRLEVFQCGGVDYISYPFFDDEVIARLRNHIAVFSARRELKSVQEELRLSKDSLKLAHMIARLGHWEWDMGSDVVRWSDEAYRILGFEPRECRPSHDILLQCVAPEERDMVAAHISQIRESGTFDLEFRIQLHDGRCRILHGRGHIACLVECKYPHIIDDSQSTVWSEEATFIGVIQDVTERKELEQRLELEAHTDALTGCASRGYFIELSQLTLEQIQHQQETLSLLMLDLDKFKSINDSYGHQVGDLTLQTLVETCSQQLRNDDVIGRLGGEEFAVLLPRTGSDVAYSIAERLRSAIEAAVVPYGDGLSFTASIGVATLAPDDSQIDALLYRADRGLYAAKQGGRNRVCIGESIEDSSARQSD